MQARFALPQPILVGAFLLVACAGPDISLPPEPDIEDAGNFEEAPLDCEAEDCVALAEGRAQICDALIARVCELNGEALCVEAPACVAAEILSELAPERCEEASTNPSFPGCRADACTVLVERVCGSLTPEGNCEDVPGCAPARTLFARSNAAEDPNDLESAERSCASALEDGVFFPACGL